MTTTQPEGQLSKTGMQLGERGLVTLSNSELLAVQPRSVEEWQAVTLQKRSRLMQLDLPQKQRRMAQIGVLLERFSNTMGVFGWANMDRMAREDVKEEWCERLWKFDVDEIKEACRKHAAAIAQSGKQPTLNAEIIRPIIIAMHKAKVDELGGNTRGPVDIPPDETPGQVKERRLMDDPDALKRINDFVAVRCLNVKPPTGATD